jgi:hypothetical protein
MILTSAAGTKVAARSSVEELINALVILSQLMTVFETHHDSLRLLSQYQACISLQHDQPMPRQDARKPATECYRHCLTRNLCHPVAGSGRLLSRLLSYW